MAASQISLRTVIGERILLKGCIWSHLTRHTPAKSLCTLTEPMQITGSGTVCNRECKWGKYAVGERQLFTVAFWGNTNLSCGRRDTLFKYRCAGVSAVFKNGRTSCLEARYRSATAWEIHKEPGGAFYFPVYPHHINNNNDYHEKDLTAG